jgi:hypothetical protein
MLLAIIFQPNIVKPILKQPIHICIFKGMNLDINYFITYFYWCVKTMHNQSIPSLFGLQSNDVIVAFEFK